ncbi:MAG: YXWGXW repeat-containing protein, partial [Candidatus Acidiferrales bacterium]
EYDKSGTPMEGQIMRNVFKLQGPMLLLLVLLIPAASRAQIAISVRIGPPVLPVYVQPACPGDGYLWTPGYWAYGAAGYYWVPGVWARPPRVGLLWTPGYWGFAGGLYAWHGGYWGPHVGFYGGINYGFGYGGVGFIGGRWEGERFMYNTAVVRVNTTVVRNVYVDRTVINRTTVVNNHYSFNGQGGAMARPTRDEMAAEHENHFQPTSNQMSHEHSAGMDHSQFASENHGQPGTMAMNRVNGRRFNQQGRIANGVASGQLTPGETRRIEGREQNINRSVRADRQANGGKLTPQERQNVNRRQNGASRQIYRDKHNDKSAPR